jgi:ribosome-associated protein
VTTEGVLVIDAREERSQSANREAARARLGELIARASRRPKSRRATKPSKAAKVRRLEGKRRHGDKKKGRSDRRAED